MAALIQEKLLDERLAGLEKARSWSPRVVSKLESLIRNGEDQELYGINPIAFAAEKGMQENEAIDLFLHATKLRLMEMNWHLICPMCGDQLQSFSSLKTLHSHLSCNLCQLNTEATLDDFIKVSFTVSHEIRDIAFHHPERLSPLDYMTQYRLSREGRFPDGTRFRDGLRRLIRIAVFLEPGQSESCEIKAKPGFLASHDFLNQRTSMIEVREGAAPQSEVTITFLDDQAKGSVTELAPGTVKVTLKNESKLKGLTFAAWIPPADAESPVKFDPFLTGKRLFTSQTFRDIFRSEVIGSSEGLAIKDLTLLFTDLKGSTELYERIGDLEAFSLVRQHFDSLAKVINRNSGAIIKTIGDAVMAAFLNPLDATHAAAEMLQEIEGFNRSLRNKEIVLKIGLHKGASIAV
ncbi:MAG TPA: DUF5939 domain-containing protein, partial [Bdellovibrionota bacterium]|nr:DUF5939 domain-containing protein [Bdellovibrionota bacterium]